MNYINSITKEIRIKMDNIKNIICALFFCMIFTSSSTDKSDYQRRITFCKNRIQWVQEVVLEQHQQGKMEGHYAHFYYQALKGVDSCLTDLRSYK